MTQGSGFFCFVCVFTVLCWGNFSVNFNCGEGCYEVNLC